MYSDAAVFASQRLKPAKTRLMTVEIDQATLIRNNTAPASMTAGDSILSIGTPSIVPASQGAVGSPTASMMSTPTVNDNIINKKADPAQGLYQTCLTLRERLRDVPDFEKFLEPPEDADPSIPEDPVTQLWRCFRMGSSLCVLFNATRPVELIRDDRLSPSLKTVNDCKAATFHFLKGIKQELDIQGDDAFMIHNLYSDDTNGFVKVTKTVTKILDILKERNLLLNRGNSDQSADTSEKKPLDNRMRIVKELVDTERKYVQDLEILQEYMRCLEREEIVSKDLIHNLFLNLNQLVDFQRRFLIRVETQNDMPPEQQDWGNLFVQYEKSFTVYEPYASNFNGAQFLAQEAREQLARMPHPVFDQLTAFLIKPVQRVTKYPLLLRDLIKQTPAIEAEEKHLPQGLEAIERITSQINEAIRKSENIEIVKDLEGRVEDWKGHKLEHFGELLLHGSFSVIKGDVKGEVEREYYIYLFERILLCCKEIGVGKKPNKTMGMGKNTKVNNAGKKSSLQLKGRIFMQNVTDVVSIARNGSYTLQIFWKGDPGVENFKIKHANEEGLTHWKKILQRQRELYTRSDTPGRARAASGQATQFAWMANTDAGDQPQEGREISDEDDDDATVVQEHNPHFSQLSGTTLNGSTTSLRGRSSTNESMPPPTAGAYLPRGSQQQPPPSATRYPLPSHTPPLTLNTNPIIQNLANSPERANGSYFSPVETPMMTARASSTSGQGYPFPRYTSNGYHDDPNHYTPTSMSRSSSREGTPGNLSYAAFQNGAPYHNGQRLQRPSLPGIGSSNGISAHSRMRSASTPNIHHMPNPSLSNIPPVPSLPETYIPYSGGPAVINRSQNHSPISPQLPIQGTDHDYSNGPSTPSSSGVLTPPPGAMSQIKIKINYNGDKLAMVVPYSIPYAQLLDRIERKVRICGNGPEVSPTAPVRIRYQDEDGDFISMNSDDDVLMAFDIAYEGAVKDPQGTFGAVTLFVQVG